MTLGPRLNSHVLRISQLKPGAWVFDREELEQVTDRTPVRRESKCLEIQAKFIVQITRVRPTSRIMSLYSNVLMLVPSSSWSGMISKFKCEETLW